MRVRVTVPRLPDTLVSLCAPVQWELRWLGADGVLCRRIAAGNERMPEVRLDRRRNSPVIAVPISRRGFDGVRPAGALYPADLSPDGTLLLSWWSGFLADVMLDLGRIGVPLEAFNTKRLEERIRAESPESPWLIDRERLCTDLRYGLLSSHSVSALEQWTVRVGIREGRWRRTDPLMQALLQATSAGLEITGLTLGMHYLIREADGARIDIQIDETGWVAVSGSMEYAESGRW